MNGLKLKALLFSLIPTTTFIPPTFPRGDFPSIVLMSSLSYICWTVSRSFPLFKVVVVDPALSEVTDSEPNLVGVL